MLNVIFAEYIKNALYVEYVYDEIWYKKTNKINGVLQFWGEN